VWGWCGGWWMQQAEDGEGRQVAARTLLLAVPCPHQLQEGGEGLCRAEAAAGACRGVVTLLEVPGKAGRGSAVEQGARQWAAVQGGEVEGCCVTPAVTSLVLQPVTPGDEPGLFQVIV
jgi:hypothetical protein